MSRRTCFTILTLGLSLVASVRAQSGSLNGLYFRIMMSSGSFAQDHWWFLPDGSYFNGVPENGPDPAAFEANCLKFPADCGQYRVRGAKISLTPMKGQPYTMDYKPLDKSNIELDGRFTKHVDHFPAGTELVGHYSWVGGASGGGTSVSASRGIQFHPDGTFTTSATAGVAAGGQYGSSSKGASRGTYKVSGNVLELNSDGKTIRYTIYPYDVGKGEVRLNIDGNMYKRDR